MNFKGVFVLENFVAKRTCKVLVIAMFALQVCVYMMLFRAHIFAQVTALKFGSPLCHVLAEVPT